MLGPELDELGGACTDSRFLAVSSSRFCGKMLVLEKLLHLWRSEPAARNKVLVFSYSVRMLDIIEKTVIRNG